MKNLLIITLLLLTVNIGACQNSNSQQRQQAAATIKSTIPAEEFEKKIRAAPQAQIVDVRTPEEYAGGHLNNALNVNIRDNDFSDKMSQLDKGKPVFVYCKAGSRSAMAADKLQEMGFKEIYNLDGGIMKWDAAGKPITGAANNSVTGLTPEAFSKLVTQNNYVLVDYNAKWCMPCRKIMPMLESLTERKKEKLTLLKIDADDNKELMKQKNISSIPYLELYNNGKLVWRHEGIIDEGTLLKETSL